MYKPGHVSSYPEGEFVYPAGGALLSLEIIDQTDVEEGSWGRIKSFYHE
ncbi:MAG: hypothetical protein JXB45_09995 [Candidatus Krumholzibacteriota bacterium]|nr:hypothetical protein [Candidatus Krumholzibacteriota bacterium]